MTSGYPKNGWKFSPHVYIYGTLTHTSKTAIWHPLSIVSQYNKETYMHLVDKNHKTLKKCYSLVTQTHSVQKGEKDKNIKSIRYNCDPMILAMKVVNKCRQAPQRYRYMYISWTGICNTWVCEVWKTEKYEALARTNWYRHDVIMFLRQAYIPRHKKWSTLLHNCDSSWLLSKEATNTVQKGTWKH